MTLQNCKIRRAKPDDLDDILNLERRCFLETGARSYGIDTVKAILEQVELVSAALIEEGHYFLIVESEELVASGGWTKCVSGHGTAEGESSPSLLGDEAILRGVYTRPDRARRGFGFRIVKFVEEDAKTHGIKQLRLTSTVPGIPFYKSLGYTDLGPDHAILPSGHRVQLRSMCRFINGMRSDGMAA